MTGVAGQQTPGTLGTPFNVLAFVFQSLLQKVQTASLVKIISCTNDGGVTPVGTVVVQPLVFQLTGRSLQAVPHGQIYNVPYFRLQGGQNAIILDPQQDDIGLAVFCSRDIANVKADPEGAVANGGAPPGSLGMFDWADGLYLGGFLNGEPTQYVEFSATGVNVVSPTKITLQAPTVEIDASTLFKVAAGAINETATGDAKLVGNTVEIQAGTTATVSGATTNVQATGTATVSGAAVDLAGPVSQTGGGSASFSGALTAASVDSPIITSDGTNVHTHEHGPGTYTAGATAVTGDSGAPI